MSRTLLCIVLFRVGDVVVEHLGDDLPTPLRLDEGGEVGEIALAHHAMHLRESGLRPGEVDGDDLVASLLAPACRRNPCLDDREIFPQGIIPLTQVC